MSDNINLYIKIKKDIEFDISNLESQLKRRVEALEAINILLKELYQRK